MRYSKSAWKVKLIVKKLFLKALEIRLEQKKTHPKHNLITLSQSMHGLPCRSYQSTLFLAKKFAVFKSEQIAIHIDIINNV